MAENQTEFKGWARVEVMGHQTHIGFVETQAFGAAVMFRIDQPEIPAVEDTLTGSEWVGETRCPAGTVVSRGKIEAATVLVGAGSIYRIIPCDEAAALKAIRASVHRPLFVVRLPEGMLITAADVAAEQDPDEDEDEDRDDYMPGGF